MTHKKRLAWLCLFCLALALIYAVGNYPQQRQAAPEAKHDSRTTNQTNTPHPDPLPVAASTTDLAKYPGFRANLFRPLFERPPKPRKPRPRKPVVKRKARHLPQPPQPATPPMAKRLASFTYLGQAQGEERRSIFLKEKNRLFVVKVGEDFGKDQEFRLVEVTDREIRIETGEPVETIRIPLQKKKPLRMKTALHSPNRKALPF